MLCSQGFALHKQYESAEKKKNTISGQRHLATYAATPASEKDFLLAKQHYLESFANWLGHKAFCHDCKPKA